MIRRSTILDEACRIFECDPSEIDPRTVNFARAIEERTLRYVKHWWLGSEHAWHRAQLHKEADRVAAERRRLEGEGT